MDWARILAYVTGLVDQELLARSEYLAAVAGRRSQATRRLRKPREWPPIGSIDWSCDAAVAVRFGTR